MVIHPRHILVLLLVLPVLEIVVLVRIGAMLGFWVVLILLLVAAAIGARLLQHHSWSIWNRLQQSLAQGEHPAAELLEGAIMMAGGLLLMIPGFLSDLMSLFCLLPVSRRWLVRYLEQRSDRLFRGNQPGTPRTIEGEYRRER